jgi:UDP-3-O-[3-hydroxymyristoyl] glucosamine N-acyltransferase
VGEQSIVMAQAGTGGHVRIGDGAFVSARAGVRRDVPDGTSVAGWPPAPEREWHRQMAALTRLPDMLRRLRAVERALEARADEAKVKGQQGQQGEGE